jgi:hypothetical protein
MTNKLMLAATLALLSSTPALAQDTPAAFDSRWTPYLGCWQIVQDQRGVSAPVPAGTMVCVRPSGRFGVAITTTVDGKNVLEQTVVADGSAQPLSQGDCSGTQTSNWSRDGERLFTAVELECSNRPKRTVSGITLLANGHWVDAQATVIDGNADVRLRRYRRTSDSYTGPAGMTTAPLSIEDIIEASAKVQSEALEAALDEANARFVLNSRVLTQLADNGVSPNVIDLLVAQAYPEKFEVQRGGYASTSNYGSTYGTASMGSSSIYMGSTIYPSPMYDPFWNSYYYYSPFAYPYYWGPSYYQYGRPFYRNNFYNYNYYGLGGGGYYGGGSVGRPSGGNAQPGDPDSRGGDGVVVNGRGYTRVRPAGSSNTSSGSGESATPTSRTNSTGRGVRSAGSRDSGSSSSSTPSSSSSSGSSSSGSSSSSSPSSGGYSSGGGGDSGGGGGRTAQPR